MSDFITAQDLYLYTTCDRRVYLKHHGDENLARPPSPFQLLLMQQGQAHEAEVVEDIDAVQVKYPIGDLAAGFVSTREAMVQGWPVIYQGVLVYNDMAGKPDLLYRVEGASDLGDWHYRPVDIKSGSSLKKEYELQIMLYMHLLEHIQGVRPATGGIILKDHNELDVIFDPELFHEIMQAIRELASGKEAQPFISSVCNDCGWQNHCLELADASQDISLISGLRRTSWAALRAEGIGELPDLADANPGELENIPGIGEKTAQRVVLQAQALLTGEMIVVVPPGIPSSSNETFFDVESVPSLDLYYLMGTVNRVGDHAGFSYELAKSQSDERAIWESFLDRASTLEGFIFHYGNYERQTIRALDRKYGPEPIVPVVLDRLFDIERAIRDSVVLPFRGSSLKTVATWLGFEWTGATAKGDDSMVEYLTYLADGDKSHLDHILTYNEDDCNATLLIRDWLGSL